MLKTPEEYHQLLMARDTVVQGLVLYPQYFQTIKRLMWLESGVAAPGCIYCFGMNLSEESRSGHCSCRRRYLISAVAAVPHELVMPRTCRLHWSLVLGGGRCRGACFSVHGLLV